MRNRHMVRIGRKALNMMGASKMINATETELLFIPMVLGMNGNIKMIIMMAKEL